MLFRNKVILVGIFLTICGWVDGNYVFAQAKTDTTITKTVSDSTKGTIRFYPVRKRNTSTIFKAPSLNSLYYIKLDDDQQLVRRDSLGKYIVEDQLFGYLTSFPLELDLDSYTRLKREQQKASIWTRLVDEGRRQQQSQRGVLDFKISLPAGRNSAFTTIFGSPELNLRIDGTAALNIGANVQKIDDPSIPPDQQTRVDPTFDQNLKLNIQGTIGDKLTISTDWDTERSFDFQNRLNIVYEGYEDEIIKRIELGNVSIETGNSLVRGGGALFGIKSIAELGKLRFTSVVSQQRGEENTQVITGGAEEIPILLRPASYDHNRHFFLDFFNRQEFENLMSNPQQIGQAFQIGEFELYIRRGDNSQPSDNAIRAVSLVNLGVNRNPDGTFGLPNNAVDAFADGAFDAFRDPAVTVTSDDLGVIDQEFDEGLYERLVEGTDYLLNRGPGYISLKRTLNPNDVIAVAFTYTVGSTQVRVGELNQLGEERTFLKMLRLSNARSNNPTFPLEMRNIYSLGVGGITRTGLELDLEFNEGNIAQNRLPNRETTLLQDLGLDRVNQELAPIPDNQIDFIASIINAGEGKLIFPYLEPFGQRIDQLLQEVGATAEERERIVYDELYDPNLSQATAETRSENNFYQLAGVSKGGVPGSYTLGGFGGQGLVEGSVRVFANGTQLSENIDYEVDYSFGLLTILNDRYVAAGQEIRIEFESNQLTGVTQRNFAGFRTEYDVSNDIKLGGTIFNLREQPQTDKLRIGSEPINNTIIGLDASADFDAPWLTRVIDRVPLLQTKEPSSISFSGEFAQLRPGVAQTNGVRDAIGRGDLFPDEEDGLAFLDDFEGAEINISFLGPARWNLAAAPVGVPGFDTNFFTGGLDPLVPDQGIDARSERADLRGEFVWYSIPRNLTGISNSFRTPESQVVRVQDVFPGRETNNPQDLFLTTLDVYYNPTQRGAYNYNFDIRDITENQPERLWGGMTTVVPPGQEDLTQNNVEFLEFRVQSLLPGAADPSPQDLIDYDGKIYIDLGLVSEDVVPNSRLNSEDGLATNLNDLIPDRATGNPRSFTPSNLPPPLGQFSNANRNLEDVGFDGMPSANGFNSIDEQTQFEEFLDSMAVAFGAASPEFQRIFADPSNDDYVFFGESLVNDLPLNERFYRMFGRHEGNTPVAGGERRAITNRPDTEGLRTSSILEQTDSYYQYEIDFNPADLQNLRTGAPGTFIVDQLPNLDENPNASQAERWYQIRVPINEFVRRVGGITDFQNIRYIRVWLSGYRKPFTLRFASFEFVGSQWRRDDQITESQNSNATFEISTINIEENGNRVPIPYRQPEGSIRAANRGSQLQSLENEQSLVLRVEDLGPGEIQMVERIYPGGLNLLNYGNMRMFVHGEGFTQRGDAELVVRMGIDLENNYYEYRQPVTPSDPNFPYGGFDPNDNARLDAEAEQVWLYDENSMNIILSAFNQLKQIRNDVGADESVRFERSDLLTEAPPGAVLAIRGNPSLDRVAEVGLGIRNPFDPTVIGSPGVPSLNAELWVNELRLSNFDNLRGWAANGAASVKLADFATVNANFTRQTNGFGGLESRLGQRRQSEQLGFDVNSVVNLHKLVPDRFGWSFPVSVSARQSTSTPRFLPNQGDIRLADFEAATNARDDITSAEKRSTINEVTRNSQTHSENYSINFSNISKRNSRSKLARYTLDQTTINYVYNRGTNRSPELLFRDNWNFNTSIRYNMTFRNVRLARPFKFTEGVPILGRLSKLRIGYTPSNITASTGLTRSFDESRRRARLDGTGALVQQPLQQTHIFNHNTDFRFGYNLTPTISTSFQTSSTFDLSRAGAEQLNQTGIDSAAFRTRPTVDVIKGVLTDTLKARRVTYTENYSANWKPRLNNIKALNWVSYSASYSGNFRWNNSPRGSNLGSQVSNGFTLNHTGNLNVGRLFDRSGFFKKVKDADRRESRNRSRARSERKRAKEAGQEVTPREQDLGKDVSYLGRKLFLALFSFKNIDVSYRTNKSSSQVGYSGSSQLFYTFNSPGAGNFSPPLGYRLGFFDSISRDQLIRNIDNTTIIQLPANNDFSNTLTWGTALELFPGFKVDLDWNARWDERNTESITLDPTNELQSVLASSGNNGVSVWAFGPGYRDLFERQVQTALDDFDGAGNVSDATGNQDGRTVLNRNDVADDFREAFLGDGTRAIGDRGFSPIPKPNWRVNWSGIEKFLPFLSDYIQRASLNHAYTGTYRIGWSFNNVVGPQSPRNIGSFSVTDIRRDFEPNSINVEQVFTPLIELDIRWKSGLTTRLGFEQRKATSLAVSSSTVTERKSSGVTMNLAYNLRNIRLPLFKNIKNNIDLALNGNIAEDEDTRFFLSNDISDALDLFASEGETNVEEFQINPREPTGQRRISGSALIGYRFSSTVRANFEYTYLKVTPKSSRTFARTDHDIKFNITIAIRSN